MTFKFIANQFLATHQFRGSKKFYQICKDIDDMIPITPINDYNHILFEALYYHYKEHVFGKELEKEKKQLKKEITHMKSINYLLDDL